jgi:hypothetical protein
LLRWKDKPQIVMTWNMAFRRGQFWDPCCLCFIRPLWLTSFDNMVLIFICMRMTPNYI